MKRRNYMNVPFEGYYLERAEAMDRLLTEEMTMAEIAERYGLETQTVRHILQRYWLTCEVDLGGSPKKKAR